MAPSVGVESLSDAAAESELPQIDVSGGQVGVIGDDAKVEGGIHFGKTRE